MDSSSSSPSSMSIDSSESELFDTSHLSDSNSDSEIMNSRDSEKRKREPSTSSSEEEEVARGIRPIDVGAAIQVNESKLHRVPGYNKSKTNVNHPNARQNDESGPSDVDISVVEDEDQDLSLVDSFDMGEGDKEQLRDVYQKLSVRSRSSKSSSTSRSKSVSLSISPDTSLNISSLNSSTYDNETTREVSPSDSFNSTIIGSRVIVTPDSIEGVFKQPLKKRSRKSDDSVVVVPRRFNESWRVSASECRSVAVTGEIPAQNVQEHTHEDYRQIAHSCTEMFRQGEISPENAFCLKMLDFINEILDNYDGADLPLVGHALAVMTKIYDCRVSNSYSSVLEIRNGILMHFSHCKSKKKKEERLIVEGEDNENENDIDIEQDPNRNRSRSFENDPQNRDLSNVSCGVNEGTCFLEKNIQLNHEELVARLFNTKIETIYNRASERRTLSSEYFSLFKENELKFKSKKVNESKNRIERLKLLEPVQDSDTDEFKSLFSNQEENLEYFDVEMQVEFDPTKHDVFGKLLDRPGTGVDLQSQPENSENLRTSIFNLETQRVELPSTELIVLEESGDSNGYDRAGLTDESYSRDADPINVSGAGDQNSNSIDDLIKLKEKHSGLFPIGHISTLDEIENIFEKSGSTDNTPPQFCPGLEPEKQKRKRKPRESTNEHFKPISINDNKYKLSISQDAISANVSKWDPEEFELVIPTNDKRTTPLDFNKLDEFLVDEDYADLNLPKFGKEGWKNWGQGQSQDDVGQDQDQYQDYNIQEEDQVQSGNNPWSDNQEHVLFQLFGNIRPSSESEKEENLCPQFFNFENEDHEDITEYNRSQESYNNNASSSEHAEPPNTSFHDTTMITELFPNAFPSSKLNGFSKWNPGFSNIHELSELIKMTLVRELCLDENDCTPLLVTETSYEFDSLIQDVYKLVKLGGKEKARLSISTIFIAMLHFCHEYNIELSPSRGDSGNSSPLIICHGKNYSQYDHIPGLIHKNGKFFVSSSAE